MPISYVLEPGFCWPGIDRSTWPPAYKLGVVTLRIFVYGLDDHITKVVDKARLDLATLHREKLLRIRRETEGSK